jgi:hypothetical protein
VGYAAIQAFTSRNRLFAKQEIGPDLANCPGWGPLGLQIPGFLAYLDSDSRAPIVIKAFNPGAATMTEPLLSRRDGHLMLMSISAIYTILVR